MLEAIANQEVAETPKEVQHKKATELPAMSIAEKFMARKKLATIKVIIDTLPGEFFTIRPLGNIDMFATIAMPLGMSLDEPDTLTKNSVISPDKMSELMKRIICRSSVEPVITYEEDEDPTHLWVGNLSDLDRQLLMRAIEVINNWDKESADAIRPFRDSERSDIGSDGEAVREDASRVIEPGSEGLQPELVNNDSGTETGDRESIGSEGPSN